MQLKQTIVYLLLCMLLISSCSRKHIPETGNRETNNTKPGNAVVKRMTSPKIIIVNDKVAKKSIDGRMYYDVNGHRYWKNYNDGKYYLFNQSMYSDSAFKPH